MKFIQIFNKDLPHETGRVYAVKEHNKKYWHIITEIKVRRTVKGTGFYKGKLISSSLIAKSIAKPIKVKFEGNENYFKQLIDFTLVSIAFELDIKSTHLEVIKYW
jgi:hypothetical protein